jgi:hypothetical protein
MPGRGVTAPPMWTSHRRSAPPDRKKTRSQGDRQRLRLASSALRRSPCGWYAIEPPQCPRQVWPVPRQIATDRRHGQPQAPVHVSQRRSSPRHPAFCNASSHPKADELAGGVNDQLDRDRGQQQTRDAGDQVYPGLAEQAHSSPEKRARGRARPARQPGRGRPRAARRAVIHRLLGSWRRQVSRILRVASGSFDGLAHEPRRHGVRLACVVFPGRSGGPGPLIEPFRQLDRDDCWANERQAVPMVPGSVWAVARWPAVWRVAKGLLPRIPQRTSRQEEGASRIASSRPLRRTPYTVSAHT